MFTEVAVARIIGPTSKEDSLRLLDEVCLEPVWLRSIRRRLLASPTMDEVEYGIIDKESSDVEHDDMLR